MIDAETHLIAGELAVPRSELGYRATRAGGPGGQHVNTSATRIELTWNVAESAALDEAQRERVLRKLAPRIDAAGNLRLTASGSRSQHQNRQAVTERLARLLEDALRVEKPRRKTRPTRASREKRLKSKRRRSEVKQRRGPVAEDE